ncbi:Iron-uptake system permease protein FeuC [Austwickia sp. TVS 96-490-7B]|uniref:FecCD family ABC transporter permease n=1 Tax=Austwickia sp. TVS 96-490-7B TaxID=2830843 RepID=UPI001C57DEF2|nr:iron ABC transporter permease [Austwickia sp. TVS 96-490-7B]MBW3084864.1 Iron-uptake system permease protein FeuC [Austwickia sp. TVS 96-490-7B]
MAASSRGGNARRYGVRSALLYLAGVPILLVTMLVSLTLGAADTPVTAVVDVLSAHLGLPSDPVTPVVDSILWGLRVPRVVTAALVGAGLAVCGATLQALTRNPLAEPYLLGLSSGASAGAVVVVVLGVGGQALGLTGGALIGALSALALLLILLRRSGLDSVRVVLTGVVVGQLFAALSSLVLMADGDAETTRAITFWLLGSMGAARWTTALTCGVALLIGLAVTWWHAPTLDALSLGSDTASSLGIDVRRTRLVLLIVTSLITAAAVAGVGAIGFVGLIVPHAIRFVVGPLHRYLLPAAALTGAVLLVITDALSRVVFSPREIPVGVLTALIGVPVFLLVMKRRGEL